MPHDVFISYSSRDKPIADAVTATLEQRKIRCWVAPRDVLPGVPYGESIIDALENSRAMVLIFSASANTSPQVMREVERAVSKGVTIIPFRIEDVTPSKSMEYFISAPHWLDAWNPPLEQHTNRLAEAIQRLLGIKEPAPTPPAATVAPATPVEPPAFVAPVHAAPTGSAPISAAATAPSATAAPARAMPAETSPISPAATATLPPEATRLPTSQAVPAGSIAPAPAAAKFKPRWWMIVVAVAALAIIVVGLRIRQHRLQLLQDVIGADDLAAIAKPEPAKCGGISLIIQRGAHGAVADAYIWMAEPDGVFNYDTLYTGMYETGLKQSLLRFDLQEIPRGAQVQKAVFHILFRGSDQPRPVRVHRIMREWFEDGVTWNNFAGQFDKAQIWTGFEGGEMGWREADITGLVQAWARGDMPNFGLLLDDLDGKTADQHERYFSSEAEIERLRPWLEVCYKP